MREKLMSASEQKYLAPERWNRIRDYLQENGAVRLSKLCRKLEVSTATVRRDLEELERRGELRRVHGGAVRMHSRLEEPLFEDKAQRSAPEKRRIAQEALKYIRSGDTVYLDAGSTVLELAILLHSRKDVTIITNSIRAIQELAGGGSRLIVLGGELRHLSQALVGPLTRHMFEELHVDKAFMGTLGLTLKKGPTTTDPGEAYTKELAMQNASTTIMLVDSNKVNKTGLSRSGSLDDVDVLITDKKMRSRFVQGLRKRNIEVVQV